MLYQGQDGLMTQGIVEGGLCKQLSHDDSLLHSADSISKQFKSSSMLLVLLNNKVVNSLQESNTQVLLYKIGIILQPILVLFLQVSLLQAVCQSSCCIIDLVI